MPPHPALAINDRLWVKSLALKDKNGEIAVFVSADLIGLLPDELDKIFAMVKDVPREKIFITTTHTHSGPDTMGLWGGKNKKYMKMLRSAVAESINESVSNMMNSSIRFGTGDFAGYANGRDGNPNDSSVNVVQVLIGPDYLKKDNQLITLVNFACHPDVVQGMQVTADFPYFLSERLKSRIGSETMFIPGAIGGVQPDADRHASHYFVRTFGENLADEVIQVMEYPDIYPDIDIRTKKIIISAPFENTGLLKKADDFGLVADMRDKNGNVMAEVNRIDLGPLKILTAPGELFPRIWWRVKSDKNTLMFGLVNGEFGYIMLWNDYYSKKHGYHASVSIGPIFGNRIMEALQKLMKD